MTKKETAFTLFDAGHSPSCPEITAISVKAQTRANYYWEWKRGGGEAKGSTTHVGGIDKTKPANPGQNIFA